MIDFTRIKPGDKLRIVGQGAPGFAKLGDIVEVVSTDGVRRCDVKREDGTQAYFALTCGAARLELVEPPDAAMSEQPTEAQERFARWTEEGPRLAEAAGCYVSIRVTASKASESSDE